MYKSNMSDKEKQTILEAYQIRMDLIYNDPKETLLVEDIVYIIERIDELRNPEEKDLKWPPLIDID